MWGVRWSIGSVNTRKCLCHTKSQFKFRYFSLHFLSVHEQLNPFQSSVAFHIVISHQMTRFYMKCDTGLKWVNIILLHVFINGLRNFNDHT